MISAYDQRAIQDIRNELLASKREDIDLPAVCIVLCDRIADLEAKIQQIDKDLTYTANTASCLANGIIPD